MELTKILLHLGFPKTGSSSLQYSYWHELEKLGRVKLNTWRKDNPSESLELRPSSSLFNDRNIEKKYLDFDTKQLNILSDESFTAPLRLRKNNFGSNIIAPEQFPVRLKNIITSNVPTVDDLQVLIVLRNQRELLFSQYVEEYNLKKYKNVELIFDSSGTKIDLEGFEVYKFSKYITELNRVYGREKVHVLFYEDLRHNHDCFFETIDQVSDAPKGFAREILTKKFINKKTKNETGYYTKCGSFINFLSLSCIS